VAGDEHPGAGSCRQRSEQRGRRHQDELDEVGSRRALLRDVTCRLLRGPGVHRGQDAARHRQQFRTVRTHLERASPATIEQVGRARHLADARDPVREHERQRAACVRPLERVHVHVIEAGHQVLAGGVDARRVATDTHRRGWRDVGDDPALDGDRHVGSSAARFGVDNGHVLEAQGPGRHRIISSHGPPPSICSHGRVSLGAFPKGLQVRT
jgi:hypothetical protein